MSRVTIIGNVGGGKSTHLKFRVSRNFYRFVPMNASYARAIDQSRYDPPYDFYNLDADEEDRREFLDPEAWGRELFAVLELHELVGFFSYKVNQRDLRIGFGLRPDLTGKRRGGVFIEEGIRFGIQRFGLQSPAVVLEVAEFNQRAIKLYTRIGFVEINRFTQQTNGGEYPFIRMRRNSGRSGISA